MKLGIPVYDGVNLLDVTGPLEMFYWAGQDQDLQSILISEGGRQVTSLNGVRFEPPQTVIPLNPTPWRFICPD